jgi:hypothetical protein
MSPTRFDPRDGRVPFAAAMLMVEEDPDGWWEDYCRVHRWVLIAPGWGYQL